MFGVGLPELMLLAVVAVLALGPDKLPEFARHSGRMVRQLQDFTRATREELRHELGPELADLGSRAWTSTIPTGRGTARDRDIPER